MITTFNVRAACSGCGALTPAVTGVIGSKHIFCPKSGTFVLPSVLAAAAAVPSATGKTDAAKAAGPAVGMPVRYSGYGRDGQIVAVHDEGYSIDFGDGVRQYFHNVSFGTSVTVVEALSGVSMTIASPTPQSCSRPGCDKPRETGSRFCCDSCFIRENW